MQEEVSGFGFQVSEQNAKLVVELKPDTRNLKPQTLNLEL
jgi:hypothetical protein